MHDDARLVLDSVIRLLESEQARYQKAIQDGSGDNRDIVRYNLLREIRADVIEEVREMFPEVGA